MNYRTSSDPKRGQNNLTNKNTIETLKDFGSSMAKNTANSFKNIGTGMFDQFFGNYDYDENPNEKLGLPKKLEEAKPKRKQEFKVFNYQEYYEREVVKRQMKELVERIRQEVEFIKKANKDLLNDVKDIQKISVEQLPEKPGVYHIQFLEVILSILKTLRAKVNESKTWMAALVSKKKKRGSLFASLSKKKGTQYSLSQEMQSSRSVQ